MKPILIIRMPDSGSEKQMDADMKSFKESESFKEWKDYYLILFTQDSKIDQVDISIYIPK